MSTIENRIARIETLLESKKLFLRSEVLRLEYMRDTRDSRIVQEEAKLKIIVTALEKINDRIFNLRNKPESTEEAPILKRMKKIEKQIVKYSSELEKLEELQEEENDNE